MSPILKLKRDNEKKELFFELKYLVSLTTRERFEMMMKRSQEARDLLEKSGHRKSFEIIKRSGSYESETLDDLKRQRISSKKFRGA